MNLMTSNDLFDKILTILHHPVTICLAIPLFLVVIITRIVTMEHNAEWYDIVYLFIYIGGLLNYIKLFVDWRIRKLTSPMTKSVGMENEK